MSTGYYVQCVSCGAVLDYLLDYHAPAEEGRCGKCEHEGNAARRAALINERCDSIIRNDEIGRDEALRAARPSFTPGPWEVWEEHARVYAGPATQNTPSTMSGIRGCVAECDEDDWGADEDEGAAIAQANATLIAAAPDLHEALRQIVERLDGDRHFINPDGGAEMLVAALAALAKAEGRAAERSDAHKALSDDSRGTP